MRLPSNLPSPMGKTKKEILDMLLYEEYGTLPSAPYRIDTVVESIDRDFCAGKAELLKLILNCQAEWGEFFFPIYYTRLKKTTKPAPAFIHINFYNTVPDMYQPTEEIVDEGCAVFTLCYSDVASDDGDFTNGLAGVVYPDGKREAHECGKIGLWAWAICAVMDYATTLPELDHERIGVVGHSRLGKTALLAGAIDKRFYCAFSNNSGCCGAALSRENTGETVRAITDRFPYWFCENYLQYADREDTLPFDQHYLLAANLPHRVYVASAAEDLWACPTNEYLSCVAASAYYEEHSGVGFVRPDRLPEVGECLSDGHIGYHLRAGTHYLSREDWQHYIKYLCKQ